VIFLPFGNQDSALVRFESLFAGKTLARTLSKQILSRNLGMLMFDLA